MPAYGSAIVPAVLVFTPGLRSVVFGTLQAQAANWAHAQGAPVWPPSPESVTQGESSQAVCFHRHMLPDTVAVELIFSTAPGTFEIDVQTADTDADANYVVKQSITNAQMNATNVARVELTNVVARFLRLNVKTLTGSVSLIASIS